MSCEQFADDQWDLDEILRKSFGLKSFRRGQRAVISRILNGKNVAAIFPTGSGKSLCYQFPSQLLEGTTIVISPLVALMKDQCASLARRGIAAVQINSSQSSTEYRETVERVLSGKAKLLFVSPERFFNERFNALVARMKVSLLAIDEAHCISQWGHHFRPDYLRLVEIASRISADRILALTATATPAVLKDIRRSFNIASKDTVVLPSNRPNLTIRSIVTEASNQYSHLRMRLKERPPGATLVYVTTQRSAEFLAQRLNEDGMLATAYHAGIPSEERDEILHGFLRSHDEIVVATIAFGMGVDKPNIRYVYHFNPPKSIEAYAQEIGRAGRDSQPAICEMIIVPEDRIVLDNFAAGDIPMLENIVSLLAMLQSHRDQFYVSHYQLSFETNIRLSVVRTLLTYLEIDKHLESLMPRYNRYRIKVLSSRHAMLAGLKGSQLEVAEAIVTMLTRGRRSFTLNVMVVCDMTGAARKDVIEQLESMVAAGQIEIDASDLTHGYRWLKRVLRPTQTARRYLNLMKNRELNERQKIDQVMKLAEAKMCQSQFIAEYLGSKSPESCGTCSFCTGQRNQTVPEVPRGFLGRSVRTAIHSLRKEYPEELPTVQDQARFLCGLSTPRMVRNRLMQHEYYGICKHLSLADVIDELTKD